MLNRSLLQRPAETALDRDRLPPETLRLGPFRDDLLPRQQRLVRHRSEQGPQHQRRHGKERGPAQSPAQREEMQKHPDESARILEPLAELHPGLSEIVAAHHERWDGDGYPDGLRGEQIPLGARIIAMADVFDALTQPRKYRDPMPPETAAEKLREAAGGQFDPAVVARLQDPVVREHWFALAEAGLADEQATDPCDKPMVARAGSSPGRRA